MGQPVPKVCYVRGIIFHKLHGNLYTTFVITQHLLIEFTSNIAAFYEPPQLSLASHTAEGENSPDSGSLYSDEIPSGYNSGEQYDTLSTGYMSGEAYELPDTRLDLHEPALDVIEECLQPLGVAGI